MRALQLGRAPQVGKDNLARAINTICREKNTKLISTYPVYVHDRRADLYGVFERLED